MEREVSAVLTWLSHMVWFLMASAVANGFLLGLIYGVIKATGSGQETQAGDVPGGGISQDQDEEYVPDTTVIGFKGPDGKKQH